MYTAEFYIKKTDAWGHVHMEKKTVKTGKKFLYEAFEVARKNGLCPWDTCRYIWE